MHKFKVGDKVKVVDQQKMLDFSVPSYAEQSGIISEFALDTDKRQAVKFLGGVWWYPVDCLDFVEVISVPVPEVTPEHDPKTYTVLDAYFEFSGYGGGAPSDMAVDGTQKILDRYADPDYTTYLKLKKRFEG